MHTKLPQFQKLLTKFNSLGSETKIEPTIFSIGGRGYYENPTTDILSFFLDNNAQHQLGNIMLKSLINCLPEKYHSLDCTLTNAPERELSTLTGKRIDLLLESENWVIVIENKIYHHQNNPFKDYEYFLQESRHKERFTNKEIIYIVLSPNGDTLAQGWYGISYLNLISTLKSELSEQFISQPINKWILLLREFILHLESIMSAPSFDQTAFDFFLENLSTIKEIQTAKENSINQYHQHLQDLIQRKLGEEVKIRLNHWGGYPALRFTLSCWQDTGSSVVLYLDEHASILRIYAHLHQGRDEEKADSIILEHKNLKEPWNEVKNTYRGYEIAIFKSEERKTQKPLVS
ncbi:PD-(D/E)XK nuclease family protein [Pasteurellaceae bacterium 20609_3]|uniref:PDDEXK-like family protein n=1 Tax=Spirabiliibacterium mucosae TaxID=28156 RepID=UPI001AADD11B|nr:PD-(D/E)XK nuclease family protein [Spirabiliibacterium mucosae]MBE2898872.1 PD-(D/E)XK nuclease family protein [Spirabiliibacterium mucosae]